MRNAFLILLLSAAPLNAANLNVSVDELGFFTIADGETLFLTDGRPEYRFTPQVDVSGSAVVFENAGRVSAQIVWGDEAFLCRLEPGENLDIVQLCCGRASSRLADAIFDPQRDAAVTFSGEGIRLTPDGAGWRLDAARLDMMRVVENVYASRLGRYARLDRSKLARPPIGWCSWQPYYQNVTKEDILENADWLARHLAPFGCEYVRIDDGWQGKGHGGGENRNWLAPSDKFKDIKALAAEIRKRGLKPGLWLCPFGQSDQKLFEEQPEAFVRKPDGAAIGHGWTGKYIIDPTSQAGQEYLSRLGVTVADDWGYQLLKFDGLARMATFCKDKKQRLSRSILSPDDIVRSGLAGLKREVESEPLLIADAAAGAIGLCPCVRGGPDVGPSWAGFQMAVRATADRLFLNTRVCYTDPDAICVAGSLTLEQAQAWASLYGLTGQMVFCGDRMTELPDERVELLRRILPVADIRPMDLYPHAQPPHVFDLKVARQWARWDVVGLFNWSGQDAITLTVGPRQLGLEPETYIYYNVWDERIFAITGEPFPVLVPPASCRVIVVRRFEERPQLLASSRHITQGAHDLYGVRWDPASSSITGISHVVGGHPVELTFSLPPGWDATGRGVRTGGSMAILRIRHKKSNWLRWTMKFVRTDVEPPPMAAPETADLAAEKMDATIRWATVEGAFGYNVYRNGELLARSLEPIFHDSAPRPNTEYSYAVSAYGWRGRQSERTAAGSFTTPRAVDRWLDELTPVSVKQGWGELQLNRSVQRNPLRINGVSYERGLGSHSHAEIVYDLRGMYAAFVAEVGIDDEVKKGQGSVVFQVFADGEKLYESAVMRSGDAAEKIEVSVEGKKRLRLVITEAGNGNGNDHADWCTAKLIGEK